MKKIIFLGLIIHYYYLYGLILNLKILKVVKIFLDAKTVIQMIIINVKDI